MFTHNTYVHINAVAVSTFLQPRWIVPSKKPNDLETGWKEICDNSLFLMSQTKRAQKRISGYSGLLSTEIEYDLMHQISFDNVCI